MSGLCGVLGWPVRHSRSPAMHEAGYAALGLAGWRYQLLPVPPELFEETVRGLSGAGFTGANVTIPHKEAALALADEATDAARAIGAANTLTFLPDGRIHADNTDAPGLIDALPAEVDPAGATAVVLGAGGTARAVVWALRDASAADVAIWNRTPARAKRIAAEVGGRALDAGAPAEPAAPGAPAGPPPAAPLPAADLLVNTTSVGLKPGEDQFAHLPLTRADLARYGCVVDLVYGAEPTALIAEARAQGIATVDGLELLVRQGARSFERWTGQPAPLGALRSGARG